MTDLSTEELRALVEASTPGPWVIEADVSHYDTLTIVVAGAERKRPPVNQMCVSVGGFADIAEAEANAALIAAAPSLAAEVLALREERERAEAIAGSIAQAMWNLGVSANGDRCAWPMLDGKIVGPEEWGRTKWRRLQAQDAALSGEQP